MPRPTLRELLHCSVVGLPVRRLQRMSGPDTARYRHPCLEPPHQPTQHHAASHTHPCLGRPSMCCGR
eukprot:10774745-Prorocentrum_lima.AAC.1